MQMTTVFNPRRFLSLFMCLTLLLSAVLGAGAFSLSVSAAETAETPAVRFDVTDNGDNTVTLSYQLKGTLLARMQCAALAYARDTLSLVTNDRSETENVLSVMPGTLISLDASTYVSYANGWSQGDLSLEYWKDGAKGLLVLYATPQNPVTYTEFTTVASLTFTVRQGAKPDASTIRLWTYEEQRICGQSVKLLTCTQNDYFTFGAANGGDKMTDATFVGNTPITGNRGEDTRIIEEEWVNRFSDVADNAPYYDAVAYVCKNNLFVGSSETTFDPDSAMTRATFATVLCRLAGEEAQVLVTGAKTESPFSDVKIGAWYTPYVLWAYENGIFLGRGDGTFGPDTEITHEQMYVVIERFVKEHDYYTKDGANVSVSSVADAEKISDWALDAIKFAFANGILIADTNRCIRPTEAAARWELAVLLESLAHLERTETGSATLDTPMAGSAVIDSCPPASDAMVRGAMQKIYEGLLSLSDEINIAAFGLNLEQFMAVYQEVAKQAELFYVGNTFRYRASNTTGAIMTLLPEYTMRGAELVTAQNVYREKMAEITAGIDAKWTDFEKVLYLHDYMATHFIYDMTLGQYDTYTFLTTGRGVCQSYTLVMNACLSTLGIENSRVTSADMNHTWNLVKLGGSWFHLDVTWDDPQPNQWGQVQHTYFLKSDSYMKAHEHYNWTCFDNISCIDVTYDNVSYTTVRTPFVPYKDGLWYYIENESGDLCRRNFRTGKTETLLETDMRWYADAEEKLYYQSMYTGLICYADVLLYNTQHAIMAYHPNSGVSEVIAEIEGNVYGLALQAEDDATYAVYELKKDAAEKTGTLGKVQLGRAFTYCVTGVVRGYFTDSQVKISLLRNGAVYKSMTAARSGIYLETEYAFSLDGIKPGRYDLTVEKKGAFTYTVKNIDVKADTDLSALLGIIPLVVGDLNGDGVIDLNDTALLTDRTTYHRPTADAKTAAADLNGDGIIDITDYAILTDGDTFGMQKTDCTVKVA